MAIDPRMPGSCHDSFVWRHSALRRRLTCGLLNDEEFLLGKCSNDSSHFPYVLCRFNTNRIFHINLQIGTLCRAEDTLLVSNAFVYLSFIPCISQAFLCCNTFFFLFAAVPIKISHNESLTSQNIFCKCRRFGVPSGALASHSCARTPDTADSRGALQ